MEFFYRFVYFLFTAPVRSRLEDRYMHRDFIAADAETKAAREQRFRIWMSRG